jgi:hypothetical protein
MDGRFLYTGIEYVLLLLTSDLRRSPGLFCGVARRSNQPPPRAARSIFSMSSALKGLGQRTEGIGCVTISTDARRNFDP